MTTVFVLTSPLQVTHALHYRVQCGLDARDCVLLNIRSINENSNQQADGLISSVEWSAVHRLESYPPRSDGDDPTSPGNRERHAREIFVSQVSAAVAGVSIERVVLGDYRPIAFRQVLRFAAPTSEIVLLDDGAGTRGVMRYRENPHGPGVITGEIVRGRPLRAFEGSDDGEDPFVYPDPRRLTFFSIYRGRLAQDDRLIENRWYRDLFSSAAPAILDETWFIGTIHAELGMTSVKHYARLVSRLTGVVRDRFVYIAHRREDPDKLALLGEVAGVEIRDLGVPFESFVADTRQAPKTIVSVGSMVVDTASRMLAGHTRTIVVLPPKDYFRGPKAAHLRNTICDAVIDNDGVLSVPMDDQQLAARLDLERLRPEVTDTAATSWPVGMLDEQVEGLVPSSGDLGRCYREAAGKGLHRLASRPQRGGLALSASIVPLGREQFRLRVSLGSNDQDVDLSIDGAVSQIVRHDDGLAAVGAAPDSRGVLNIRVLGVSPRRGPIRARLHTMAGPKAKGSIHEGDPMLGFAVTERPRRVPSVDLVLRPGSIIQLQVDHSDPLFSTFPLEWDGGKADLVLAETDSDVMAAIAAHVGSDVILLPRRRPGDGRWPVTTPLQIAILGNVLKVRAERGEWRELASKSSRLRVGTQDGLGGSSRVIGWDRADMAAADTAWTRELSRFVTMVTSVKSTSDKD
jgi:hypothetical protein